MIDQTTIERVQAVEFDIMAHIDAICQRHSLTYFAIGGTVLGAVRHGGFIPWDDDMDIGMPRKDYEAFLRIAAQELPKEYHIQHFTTEPASPFYFTKIRKAGTRFVEHYLQDAPIHHGIFVDIFPFDNVPVKPFVRDVHFRICRGLYQLYLCKSLTTVCSSRFGQKQTKKLVMRRIAHTLLLPVPKKFLYWLVNTGVQLFNNREAVELSHIVRRRLRVRLDGLYPLQKLPFGHTTMPVPKDYDGYLRAQFGSYEQLPPEEKRFGHLPFLVEFDTQEEFQ